MTPSASPRVPGPPPGANPAGAAYLARAHELCVRKARQNIRRLADEPKSAALAEDGDYFRFPEGFFEIGNWTSSFHTGMALLAYRATRDVEFLAQVERLKPHYRDKVAVHGLDTMHDLGFLYSLFAVALHKLTGSVEHREIALLAADRLALRFIPEGGYLRAWGRMDDAGSPYLGLAIIDSLMNLPLLFWAAEAGGKASYGQIATRHASTTLRLFVRPDATVRHAYRFDPATGAPAGPDNFCARSVDSHWARGASWAIYGFSLAYDYTRERSYLDAAVRIARRFVEGLDGASVPVWDFQLPPGEPALRDSSAAAVAVCGLDLLVSHAPDQTGLAAAAELMLQRLCSPEYLDSRPECPGLLRQAQIGDGVGRARSAYTSWGDYFFMEALHRRLHGEPGFW